MTNIPYSQCWVLLFGWFLLSLVPATAAEAFWAPPTSLALNDSSVIENAAPGTLVGRFITTDADAGDTFTYSLSEGEGSDDNGLFQVTGDSLLTDSVFNYEDDSVFVIQVTTTDQLGEFYTTSFIIKILDETTEVINLPPTDVTLSNTTVAEKRGARHPCRLFINRRRRGHRGLYLSVGRRRGRYRQRFLPD